MKSELGRLALKLLAGALLICGIVGIVSLLTGSFGPTQQKILGSLLPIVLGVLSGFASATQWHSGRFRPLIKIGFAAAGIAIVLTLYIIWGEVSGKNFWKTVATCWALALGVSHLALIVANPLPRRLRHLLKITYVAVVAIYLTLLAFMWFEIDPEKHYRPLGVLGIVAVVLTILVPVLKKMLGTDEPPAQSVHPGAGAIDEKVAETGTAIGDIKPIGIIRTPHLKQEGTPIQSPFGEEFEGEAILLPEFAEGLDDLDGFERIWLIYRFHKAKGFKLKAVPYRDTREHGIFAIRGPRRPNHIGMSAVRLLSVDGNRVRFRGADMLDDSPLLDIKPYSPRFDVFPDSADGWLSESGQKRSTADGRFDNPDAT